MPNFPVRPRTAALAAAVVPLLLAPRGIRAQRAADLTVFGARPASALGEAPLVGAAFRWQPGVVGVRASFEVATGETGPPATAPPLVGDAGPSSAADAPGTAIPWAADADVVVSPLRAAAAPSVGGVVEPYGFVGLGRWEGPYAPAGEAPPWSWSWGGGVALGVGSRLTLSGEARRREPLLAQPAPTGPRGWEVRAGVGIRVGPAGRTSGRTPRRRGRRGAAWSAPTDTMLLGAPGSRYAAADEDRGADRAPAAEGATVGRRIRVPTSASAEAVLDAGEGYLGVDYLYGGTDPRSGLDCSAFVQRAFREVGVHLPRTSRQQARVGTPLALDLDALQPGDLLFFASDGRRIDHVAVFAGDGLILHSSSSGRGVRYDDLDSRRGRWFRDHVVAARRILGG